MYLNTEKESLDDLQDGPDTVCHGVDALNTETQEVTVGSILVIFLKFHLVSLCLIYYIS